MITYLCIGVLVAVINWIVRGNQSANWLLVKEPSLMQCFIWVIIWPVLVAYFIYELKEHYFG